jgi:dTDP-4-dehydrorhamnose reductase
VIEGNVLITGGGGQLSSDLAELLPGAHSFSHSELDITDDAAVARAVEQVRPAVVINCAAFHNVDLCETEEQQAFAVNATAVKRMAQRCADAEARLVHLSTNYVFSGDDADPYNEDAVPRPRTIYGISKLAGEHAALGYAPGALVVRGAGLYGLHGSASKGGNFVTRMVTRARDAGAIRMVADQRLSPTFTVDLAAAIVTALEAGTEGVLHLTASGDCSWFEFTQEIVRMAAVEVDLEAVETTRSGASADRPRNGVLSGGRGLPPLRHWRDALADYMSRAGLMG